MPTAKTECTELSVGFGLLQCDPVSVTADKAVKLWDGTLDKATFLSFTAEYQSKQIYYRQFYNIGVELACSHKVLARSKITYATWEGPRQQASTVSLPKDIVVSNVPISVKANSNVVANPSPVKLFYSLPNGISNRTKAGNWYLQTGGMAYQNLYTFVRNTCDQNLPLNVTDYHKRIKGAERKILSSLINGLSVDGQKEFDKLYNQFCYEVAEASAERFNSSLTRLDSSMKNSVFENVLRLFFRLGESDYVLCGLDNGQSFSIIIPNLTSWKRDWRLSKITALPDLAREQSVVNFSLNIGNKSSRKEMEVKFHSEIRWSHGKFNGNPEAKLYKEFDWVSLPFLEKIGPPQIHKIELIGTGGFGHVYRAKIAASDVEVALKEFSAQGSELDRSRFLREVNLQLSLDHPNILPILLSDLSASIPWFVAPLARCNLVEFIPELTGDTKRISHIFRQVLMGMKYAHEKNVIHRDIKPENILVFVNDHIEIGDFGLGKDLKDIYGPALTQSSENALGTLNYAAPEQLISFRDTDRRADIYALGKTLFHMLTGQCPPPFYEDIPLDIIEEKYRAFIGKCTEEDPGNRFQSVQQALGNFDNIK